MVSRTPRSRAAGQDLLLGVRVVVVLALLGTAAGCAARVDFGAVEDARTAARVKTALVNDPHLGPRTIGVRVVRGVAELSGRVPTQADADRAVVLARGVAGVADVRSRLQISADPVLAPAGEATLGGRAPFEPSEVQDNPSLLALGGSIGWSTPHAPTLKTRVALSPLVKLGSGSGFGWAFGLNWFQAELQSLGGRSDVLTRVHVKPVMLGIGYTVARERFSLSASAVGGYAWNSLTVTETGSPAGLPVEVRNSLAWRPGVSLWYDISRKTALNLSVGHVMTRLRLTVLNDGRLERRSARGDTTIVHAGIAYKLF